MGWNHQLVSFWVGCYVGFRECILTWRLLNQNAEIKVVVVSVLPSCHQFWDVHVVRTLIPHASIILGMQWNACKCLETEWFLPCPSICPYKKWVFEALRLETYSLPAVWGLRGFKRNTYGLYDFKMVKGGNAAKQAAPKTRHVEHVEYWEYSTVIQSTDMCFKHHQVANLKLNHRYLGTDGNRFVTVAAFLVCKDKIRWTNIPQKSNHFLRMVLDPKYYAQDAIGTSGSMSDSIIGYLPWGIIPLSKWLISMVSKSPTVTWGCSSSKWPCHGLYMGVVNYLYVQVLGWSSKQEYTSSLLVAPRVKVLQRACASTQATQATTARTQGKPSGAGLFPLGSCGSYPPRN